MITEKFLDALFSAARDAGIETAEVYAVTGASFRASSTDGSLNDYSVSDTAGLSLRGTVNGRMGYASTQAFDDDAITQLVEGVIESASLNEAEEQDEIYAGDPVYPTVENTPSDLENVTAEQKLQAVRDLDQAVREVDPRITKVQHAAAVSSSGTLLLRNSRGLELKSSHSYCYMFCMPLAIDGSSTASEAAIRGSVRFDALDPKAIAREAADSVLSHLNASPVPSGTYRIVLDRDAMTDLLSTFCGMFSAEQAQQKMSLLAGREGTRIAADCITLMDDPLMKDGLASTAFDAEGCATFTKKVIDQGTLVTLLHNRKTARKQGVTTTANAVRAGYNGAMHVGPSNMFIVPGSKSRDELLADMGNGLLITGVTGLHAGANPISGDFSLLSKGFLIENGVKVRAVEQITVAGNFYELLKNIRAVANDLEFFVSTIASPSVDAGEMTVSGT